MSTFTIGFTGHRNRQVDIRWLKWILTKKFPNCRRWLHGGASGFDTQVDTFAKKNGITPEVFKPDYENYPAHTAPLTRNRHIVDQSDLIVACWDGRTTGGTFFTIRLAAQYGVPVMVLPCSYNINMGSDPEKTKIEIKASKKMKMESQGQIPLPMEKK
jgi:hypothetical protein